MFGVKQIVGKALGATGKIHKTNCGKDVCRQVALGGDPVEVRANAGTSQFCGRYRQSPA